MCRCQMSCAMRQFKCNATLILHPQTANDVNANSVKASHSHTHWIVYMVEACAHVLNSCQDWQIQLHAHAKVFLRFNLKVFGGGQGFLSIKRSSDKGNVFILRQENNLQNIWIKSEGTAGTSGSCLPASFTFLWNFFARCRHEKIRSGELNLCQRRSGK